MSDATNGDFEREAHSRHSQLRETIVEHVFVGDLLRHLWCERVFDAEILRSDFDAGYDLVLTRKDIVRHIQLKALRVGGATKSVNVSLMLSSKPSGCVLALGVTDDLAISNYRWFGGAPGRPLPDISKHQIAKHPKGNSKGVKHERPGHRKVGMSTFRTLPTIAAVAHALLGDLHAADME